MREIVLLYGFHDKDRLLKVKKALLLLGIRLKEVEAADYSQAVGYMAGVKEIPKAEKEYEGEAFEKELMVMAGLSSGKVDDVLRALRKSGAGPIHYKAVLTPTNQFWDGVKLYGEIAREHEAMSGRKAPAASE